MKELRTIILAAGKGTRLKSKIPKVLQQICGEPILHYVLDIAKAVGSLKTYVVVGHKSVILREYLSKAITVVEQGQLLGTADAVKCVRKYLKSFQGDVMILCGDTPLLRKSTVKNIVRRHKKTKAACTFLTTVVHQPQGYGRIIRDDNGQVIAIREDKDTVGYEKDLAEINVGVYCFRARALFETLKEIKINKRKKEFYLTDIIEILSSKQQRVETVEADDSSEGLGVNTAQDLIEAETILRHRILNQLISQGVRVIDPATTYIDAGVKVGSGTVIRPFTYIENHVQIGNRCLLGPFARIRSGSKIGNDVEVGNFTEIVRTKIGNKTLMKHFSYLGDTVVGSNVNIGAGMVTANFDGKQKNDTKIANGAFIGSDAVLIAPVKIGKKTVIGAGSVVTKGKTIPDGRVAMGVPARIISRRGRR